MAYDRLLCPTCNCPLAPASGSTTGMPCPRCNTWIDIDPKCTGSCLSCHKTSDKELSSTCTTDEAIVVKVQLTASGGVTGSGESAKSGSNNLAEAGWKLLFKKLFPVR